MSYEEDDNPDSFIFGMMMIFAPFCIFLLGLHFSFMYLKRALWKPFWKRYTDKGKGRVCRRERTVTQEGNEGGRYQVKVKHAIIQYNVNGIRMQRTFNVTEPGQWNSNGRPPIGSVSLETFDDVNDVALCLIPGVPESAIPELEWEIQQRPYTCEFYAYILFIIALTLAINVGGLVPFLWTAKWRERALVVIAVLYVTPWPAAYIVARRSAFAQMKRQETTKDFTTPLGLGWGWLFHSTSNEDEEHASNLELPLEGIAMPILQSMSGGEGGMPDMGGAGGMPDMGGAGGAPDEEDPASGPAIEEID